MRYRVVQDFSDDRLVGFEKCRLSEGLLMQDVHTRRNPPCWSTLFCVGETEWSVRAVMHYIATVQWLTPLTAPRQHHWPTQRPVKCNVMGSSAVSPSTAKCNNWFLHDQLQWDREFTVYCPNVYIPTWSMPSVYIAYRYSLCYVLLYNTYIPGGVDERQGELQGRGRKMCVNATQGCL